MRRNGVQGKVGSVGTGTVGLGAGPDLRALCARLTP